MFVVSNITKDRYTPTDVMLEPDRRA